MVKTDIFVSLDYNYSEIKEKIEQKLMFPKEEIISLEIIKKAPVISPSLCGYNLRVVFSVSAEREAGILKMKKKACAYLNETLQLPGVKFDVPVVIVGAGPAGLFAALALAMSGGRPIVIERGSSVDERRRSVERFFGGGELHPDDNIQFGEGGAGAFSDGKLKVGNIDKYKKWVLLEFVSSGAPEDILYTTGAHLGTDKLPIYVKRIREKIISLGGQFIFNARFVDYSEKCGAVCSVTYEKSGSRFTVDTNCLVLATGHSARDTFEMLYAKGVPMRARGFGVGMRIEHPREYINSLVYPCAEAASHFGTASYHLVSHPTEQRSLYSFCMCPGGTVVAATSEPGAVVTNGMSEFSRMSDNSNSALLVSVSPSDFGSDHPLSGFEYQRKIERAAFAAAGGDYSAPGIALSDFLRDGVAHAFSDSMITPSYNRGVCPVSPREYLPEYIISTMRSGLLDFDAWMPGFISDSAILTGPETRSTSPVMILRDNDSYELTTCQGLYAIGEGAGYSGGIVSSALDGVRCAEKIIQKNKEQQS